MPAPRSPLFIVNPIAGSGRAHSLAPRIDAWMDEHRIDGRLVETSERGHAEQLAADATADGHDRVIAVGGDGTIQEVLNGLVAIGHGPNGGAPVLGIVPAGRGNDVARGVGISPNDPIGSLPVAAGDRTQPLDVGKATDERGTVRYFGAAGGVGFDAEVAWTMAVNRKAWMRGEAGYFLATLNELRRYRNRDLRVTLRGDGDDRVIEQRSLFIAFANGPFYGGGMQICPDASTNDGWLDICLVGDLSRFEALRELPGIYKARHVNNPKVEIVPVRGLGIEGDGQTRVHLDGEPFDGLPLEVSVLPGAVNVAVG